MLVYVLNSYSNGMLVVKLDVLSLHLVEPCSSVTFFILVIFDRIESPSIKIVHDIAQAERL